MPTAEQARTEKMRFLHNTVQVQVDGETSAGAYTVVEFTGPRGDMPPLHVHRDADEAFYVIEGRLTIFVGGQTIELAAGECVFAQRGAPHVYRVESDGARWLAICSPAGFETFVREVAATPGLGPAELTEISARYGIEILGPPGALPA